MVRVVVVIPRKLCHMSISWFFFQRVHGFVVFTSLKSNCLASNDSEFFLGPSWEASYTKLSLGS